MAPVWGVWSALPVSTDVADTLLTSILFGSAAVVGGAALLP